MIFDRRSVGVNGYTNDCRIHSSIMHIFLFTGLETRAYSRGNVGNTDRWTSSPMIHERNIDKLTHQRCLITSNACVV